MGKLEKLESRVARLEHESGGTADDLPAEGFEFLTVRQFRGVLAAVFKRRSALPVVSCAEKGELDVNP